MHAYTQARSFGSKMSSSLLDMCMCVMLDVPCSSLVYWCSLCTVYVFWLRVCVYLCIGTSFNSPLLWSASERAFDECARVCACVWVCVGFHVALINENETQIFHSINCHSNNECLDKKMFAACVRVCLLILCLYRWRITTILRVKCCNYPIHTHISPLDNEEKIRLLKWIIPKMPL